MADLDALVRLNFHKVGENFVRSSFEKDTANKILQVLY